MHDLSDGGLAVALAECAAKVGAEITLTTPSAMFSAPFASATRTTFVPLARVDCSSTKFALSVWPRMFSVAGTAPPISTRR